MLESVKKVRRRWFAIRRARPGESPGAIEAAPDAQPTTMSVMAYGPDGFEEKKIDDVGEVEPFLERWPVCWLNISGLADVATLQRIGERFGIHRLVLEDVVNIHQRPKIEEYGHDAYLVVRAFENGDEPRCEQISLYLTKGLLLTFEERATGKFRAVRRRIRHGKGNIRHRGPGYLAYALLDTIIDQYFPLMERYDDRLGEIEDAIIGAHDTHRVHQIHVIKRELLAVRRAVWPLREVIHSMLRDESELVDDFTRVHLRDCHDHIVDLLDLLETYREMTAGLMDAHLSIASNRMNEVMKVLTIVATIFIPLSFIAGVYGMNFDPSASPWNMPELGWPYGYPAVLLLMLLVGVGMLACFRAAGWLGGPPRRRK